MLIDVKDERTSELFCESFSSDFFRLNISRKDLSMF